jgi:hypothetical protein
MRAVPQFSMSAGVVPDGKSFSSTLTPVGASLLAMDVNDDA